MILHLILFHYTNKYWPLSQFSDLWDLKLDINFRKSIDWEFSLYLQNISIPEIDEIQLNWIEWSKNLFEDFIVYSFPQKLNSLMINLLRNEEILKILHFIIYFEWYICNNSILI